MANGGWHESEEEWRRWEAPIKSLDAEVERFASLHSLPIMRNQKDWPGRSMVWDNGVSCLIQCYLDDVETLGINLWICASQDRGRERFWKQEFLCKGASLEDVKPRITELLGIAKHKLDEWSAHSEQLESAAEIAVL